VRNLNDIKIIKKNGDLVDFDPDKIYNAVIAAGGSEEVAEKIRKYIIEELPKIESSKIRELVLQKLEKYDPEAYDSWIKYDLSEKKAS
jgi:transcriptional regulator NrdR family protein